uniref:Uncharacterized protein n=1 Tax=Arundo donax TaxID=35708 RepID=A0A0A8Z8I4_ARUDO
MEMQVHHSLQTCRNRAHSRGCTKGQVLCWQTCLGS